MKIRWSIESPLSPSALADRIRAAPRWDGWRDGFKDGRFLVAENYPVQCGPDGFTFLVSLNPRWPVVVSGSFHDAGEMTRIDMRASIPRKLYIVLGMATVPILAVPLVGLWSVSRWLAIALTLVPMILVALAMTLGFLWNARMVRDRINRFLTAPEVSR